jgi:hypothetical protein
MSLPTMPPMAPPGTATQSDTEPASRETAKSAVAANPQGRDAPSKIAANPTVTAAARPGDAAFSDEDVIRGNEQLVAMCRRLGKEGGTLRIAPGADLDLPTILIEGAAGRYQFLAEAGARRPRLSFKPPAPPAAVAGEWALLVNLRSGSLHLQGLDLVIPDDDAVGLDQVAAVGLAPGTELSLTDCTVTVAVKRPRASAFVLQQGAGLPQPGASEPVPSQEAVIRLQNCFVRSGGDAVMVAPGGRLSMELANTLVATEGSMLHASGGLRPTAPAGNHAIRVRLEQVTARVKGGLIALDSTPDQPELSSVDVVAENSIMSTDEGDDPLFRLEGQDQLKELHDKIRWEGRKVAYHRIKTYRRDEVIQTGVSPRLYDRNDWTTAFLPKDESPIVGDVKFLREADSTQQAWKLNRDDLRLAPASPVARLGPDLNRIPAPPQEDGL